jgi:hypothetical protein
MISIELAHPHDHLARRFLIDPELMADLLVYYPKKTADRQTIGLIDLTRLECKSPVTIDEQLVEGIGDLRLRLCLRGASESPMCSCSLSISPALINGYGYED